MKNKKYSVFGICTDTIMRDGQIILKDGKRLNGAVGWYRVVNPLAKLGHEISIGYGIKADAESAVTLKEKGDIWFMKIADNEGIDHIYGAHKEFTGAKIVIDLDDDPDHVNLDHPEYKELEAKRDMRLRMIKLADHVVVATEDIKQAIKYLNPNITVIPNAIDPEIWKVKRKKRTDGKIRIGWISSGSHISDLPIIENVMKDILDKYENVEFHLAGMVRDNAEGNRVFHHIGTTGYADFPQFYADLDFDIAIAPLKDNQFNRCKSNIKWMEAAMLELPMVASDVKPYHCIKHGETGYLSTTPNQMTKYLGWLIESKELRERIGKNAKKEVLKNWTIDKFLPEYTKLFDKIMEKKDITVVTAITGKKDSLEPQPQYPGVDYVAFLDENVKDEQWNVRRACNKFAKPVMNAKIHKILTHKYVDTEYIVWQDGNMILKQDPHELVKIMGDKDFAFFKHPGRDCLFDEADACINLNKGVVTEIGEQVKDYSKQMFPTHAGLTEMTAFIRRNNKKTNDLFEKWWVEITRYSNRDQISFPVVFKGKKWVTIPGTVAKEEDSKVFVGNDYWKYKTHKHYE
jgi:glycosyltransferase involved in cell wall biosynthesis